MDPVSGASSHETESEDSRQGEDDAPCHAWTVRREECGYLRLYTISTLLRLALEKGHSRPIRIREAIAGST
jgi:hypothetical protein